MGESIHKANSVNKMCTVEIKIDLTASDVNIKKRIDKKHSYENRFDLINSITEYLIVN